MTTPQQPPRSTARALLFLARSTTTAARASLLPAISAIATLVFFAQVTSAEPDVDVKPAETNIAKSDAIAAEALEQSEPTIEVSAQATPPQLPKIIWTPSAIGNRWTYIYVSERQRAVGENEPVIEKVRGTRVDEITATAPGMGDDVFRLTTTLLGRSTASPAETSSEQTRYFHLSDSSYELVAEDIVNSVTAATKLVYYDAPLAVLVAQAQPGQRWTVGVRSEGDLHTKLEGEVLGIQDAETPSGTYEDCLVVRLTGQVSGVVEAYGTRMEVPSGDITVTTWYAPGVGLVLAKEERSQVLLMEDGTSIEYSERSQFALRSRRTAAASPAAITPSN
ncbi:MAG: hypothetical protein ACI8W3_000253 [Myxococcota bacterium]|jgi:hypothetical protein